jgi:hypothetical protein
MNVPAVVSTGLDHFTKEEPMQPWERTRMELRARRTAAEITEDIASLMESRKRLLPFELSPYFEYMLSHPEEDEALSDALDNLSIDEKMLLIEEVILI